MKMKHQLLLLLFGILLFNACNDCHLVECGYAVAFDLEINDSISGKSLLTSTDSTYHVDSIVVGSINEGQFVSGHFYEQWSTSDPTNLICIVHTQPDIVVVQLNSSESDTLRFASTFIEDECCSFYRLDSVSINNGSMMVLQNDLVTILK